MEIDPGCNMEVAPKTAAATWDYKGKTYYFCAPGCKTSFMKDPEMYLAQDHDSGHEHHGHH